ncbi:ParB family protein [Leifsonia poae]|uniref:ParB family protein n=1 Tax=Leifsonia poae TaxID=110933 RepID=UPI001CBDB929|nr:hypothetical protein [Leifsonia poae]
MSQVSADERFDGDAQDDPLVRITVYVRASVRRRSRAAFEATSHSERDRSWSHLVEKALLAESERRETHYNDQEPFEGGERRFRAGRGFVYDD